MNNTMETINVTGTKATELAAFLDGAYAPFDRVFAWLTHVAHCGGSTRAGVHFGFNVG